MKKRSQDHFMRSWQRLVPHLDDMRQLLNRYKVDTVYLVGTRARGLESSAIAPYEMQLPYGVDHETAVIVCRSMTKLLTDALGVPVTVSPNLIDDEKARAHVMSFARPLFTPPTAEDELPQVNRDLRAAVPKPIEVGLRRRSSGGSPHAAAAPQQDDTQRDDMPR